MRPDIPLQACLNGDRAPGWRSRLPTAPIDLAAEARAAVEAGATSLHIHPRGPGGGESLAPEDVAGAIAAIRAALPGTPIGVSTGAWILPGAAAREAAIRSWHDQLPDFASVNFREEGAGTLVTVLREKGVGIEAGLRGAEDVQSLDEAGAAEACLRLLIEPREETAGSARSAADAIIRALDEMGTRTGRLLHGHGGGAWPMLDYAAALGYETRIGLEDVGTFPDGRRAEANADLVSVATIRYLAART